MRIGWEFGFRGLPWGSAGFRPLSPGRPGGGFAYSFNLPPGVEGGDLGERKAGNLKKRHPK